MLTDDSRMLREPYEVPRYHRPPGADRCRVFIAHQDHSLTAEDDVSRVITHNVLYAAITKPDHVQPREQSFAGT